MYDHYFVFYCLYFTITIPFLFIPEICKNVPLVLRTPWLADDAEQCGATSNGHHLVCNTNR